jgi:hypothetical protein
MPIELLPHQFKDLLLPRPQKKQIVFSLSVKEGEEHDLFLPTRKNISG